MKKLDCPSCGGTLGIPDRRERIFKCSFCGSVIEDQSVNPTTGPDRGVQPVLVVTTQQVNSSSLPTYSAPRGRVALVTATAVIAIGVAIAVSLAPMSADTDDGDSHGSTVASDDVPGLGGSSFRSGVILTADDENAAVMAVVQADGDFVAHYLSLKADDAEDVRWHDNLGAQSGGSDRYVTTAESVYLAVEDRLFGWDRSSGERRFAVDLSDSLRSSICDDCLQVIGGSVVALTSDGVLSGIDPENGQTKWQISMTEVPRQLLDYGGKAAVLDKDESGAVMLEVVDVTDGSLTATVPLRCNGEHGAGIYDYLLPLPDGGFFWEGTDIIASCAQRFAPGASSPTWELPLPDGGVAVDNDASIFAVVDENVVAVHDDTISWYALADGTRTETVREDEDLAILGSGDGRLYMAAESTRGTSSWTILGLDPASGQIVWSHEPGSDLIETGTIGITRSGWLVDVIDGGLVAITTDEDAETIRFQVLAADDGRSTDSVTLEMDPYAFLAWPSVLGSNDGNIVLGIGTSILVVDPTTGDVVTTLP